MGNDPFRYLVPRKMDQNELARAIRDDIADEIEAINIYQSHHDATDDERARKVLGHVIQEEREHLAEFLELLKLLDAGQVAALREAPTEVEGLLGGGTSARAEDGASSATAGAGAAPSRSSMGELFGETQG